MSTTDDQRKRWPKHAAWLGLVLTLIGFLSYFLVFYQFPSLRDVPVLNLTILLLGVILSGAGCWGVFKQGRGAIRKTLAGLGLLLSLGLFGLFNFYVFALTYQLPKPTTTAAVEEAAPEFTLLDEQGNRVSLADYRGKKVVLVFYRGFW
jgi:hypothetical protein